MAGARIRRSAYRQLLLCRAALGASFDFGDVIDGGTLSLTKPPVESPGVLYDSVRGGPHCPTCSGPGDDDSAMFVLYDLAQVSTRTVVRGRQYFERSKATACCTSPPVPVTSLGTLVLVFSLSLMRRLTPST